MSGSPERRPLTHGSGPDRRAGLVATRRLQGRDRFMRAEVQGGTWGVPAEKTAYPQGRSPLNLPRKGGACHAIIEPGLRSEVSAGPGDHRGDHSQAEIHDGERERQFRCFRTMT